MIDKLNKIVNTPPSVSQIQQNTSQNETKLTILFFI